MPASQYVMQLQKEVKFSPAVKKICCPKKAVVKNDLKSKLTAKKVRYWQNFNSNDSGEFGTESALEGNTNLPKLSL